MIETRMAEPVQRLRGFQPKIDIRPVIDYRRGAVHVSPERGTRVAARAAFGADDPRGADFRVCRNFGPLTG